MRAKEFLILLEREESINQDPLYPIKFAIASKIKDLPNTPDTQKALQEIEEMLSHIGAGGKLGLIKNKLQAIDDPDVNRAQKLLAKYILSISMDQKQRDDLFSKWEKDQLINIKLLLSPGNHKITDVINGYDNNPAIRELANDLSQIAALGHGKGEFLLSVFSKSITKLQKGDLLIGGKQIEVKTYDIGGGRFYDQEVKPAAGYSAAVENFLNTYGTKFSNAAASGLKLTDLITLSEILSSTELPTYYKDVATILKNIFPGMDISDIMNGIKGKSLGEAKQAYALTNLAYYQKIKTEDYGILSMNLQTDPISMVFFRNPEELEAGGMRLHASTVYPVSTDPRNAYPQMKIVKTKGKVVDPETPTPLAKSKPKAINQPPRQPITKSVTSPPGVINKNRTLAKGKIPMGAPVDGEVS